MRLSTRTISSIIGVLVVLVAAFVGAGQIGGQDGGRVGGGEDPPDTRAHATVAGTSSGWIDAVQLPAEAREVLAEIDHGGPFDYPGKDGSVFGNYEGLLPHQASGYYHEYTVETPGSSTRGARRIITGRDGELYWTADHYESFRRIRR